MKIHEAAKQLKEGNFYPVYLLAGQEDYLRDYALTTILENLPIEMPELNISRLRPGDDFAYCLQAVPILSTMRAAYAGLHEMDEDGLTLLQSMLPAIPAATVLVLLWEKLEKKDKGSGQNTGNNDRSESAAEKKSKRKGPKSSTETKGQKIIKEIELWVRKNGCAIDCETLKENEAADYLCLHAAKSGLKISRTDAQFLFRYVGGGLSRMVNELDKLALICTQATQKDIRKYASPSADYNVFTLHDLLLQKNWREAHTLEEEILKEEPNPVGLISLLAGNLELMLIARACADARYRPEQIKKAILDATGVAEFRAEIAMRQSGRMEAQQIRRALQKLSEIEFDAKQGNINAKTDLFAVLCDVYM